VNAHQGALVTLSDSSEAYVVGLRRWDKAYACSNVPYFPSAKSSELPAPAGCLR
jgi:hypothetical protein